jgi:hypothetical protein
VRVARSTASHASVAFLRIPDFAQAPVTEQAQLKERLEQVVAAAMPEVRIDERIVADAPEGLAVIFLANPAAALKLAWSAEEADVELGPAIGIAHGPVRVAHGQPAVLYGDALLAAEGAARATNPGGVSATRDFRDALSRTHPGLRRLLARAGSAIDDQGRAFEIFRADVRTAARRRQRFFAATGAIVIAVLATGFAIQALKPPPPAPLPLPAPAPAPEALPGAITFEVKPEGDIYVDGELKGKSPPLKKIQVPPGDHAIEVRNGGFKPLVTQLDIGPGEEFAVTHSFVAATPPRAPVKTKSAPRPKPPPKPATPAKEARSPMDAAAEKGFWERFSDWFKNGS